MYSKKKKLFFNSTIAFLLVLFATMSMGINSYAEEEPATIFNGNYVEDMDISGLTAEEATAKVNEYIEQLKVKTIQINIQGTATTLTLADLGLTWANTQIIDEAASMCRQGNVIKRYKDEKDMENNPVVYTLEVALDEASAKAQLETLSNRYCTDPVNASLTKTASGFTVTPESNGTEIDVDTTYNSILELVKAEYKNETLTVDATVTTAYPAFTAEQIQGVNYVSLGTKTTSFSAGAANRNANISNAASIINGDVVYPGEEYSVDSSLQPYTYDNGYYPAGSYAQGMVVDSMGGGICQVSTTLYNALLYSELEITQRTNHSMKVGYVDLGADAAISENYLDLKFVNNTDYPIYIEAYTSSTTITVTIYGNETRPSNRRIAFYSEVVSETQPGEDVITEDPSLPSDYYKVTQKAIIGYKANYYKIVYVDEVEQERILINTSTYKSAPNYITVGTAPVETQTESTAAETTAPTESEQATEATVQESTAAPQ